MIEKINGEEWLNLWLKRCMEKNGLNLSTGKQGDSYTGTQGQVSMGELSWLLKGLPWLPQPSDQADVKLT